MYSDLDIFYGFRNYSNSPLLAYQESNNFAAKCHLSKHPLHKTGNEMSFRGITFFFTHSVTNNKNIEAIQDVSLSWATDI